MALLQENALNDTQDSTEFLQKSESLEDSKLLWEGSLFSYLRQSTFTKRLVTMQTVFERLHCQDLSIEDYDSLNYDAFKALKDQDDMGAVMEATACKIIL